MTLESREEVEVQVEREFSSMVQMCKEKKGRVWKLMVRMFRQQD